MAELTLNATPRTATGKGVARKLRAQGLIPAVVYGRKVDTQSIQVSPADLAKVLSGEYNINTIFNLAIEGGETREVMLKSFTRHPVHRNLLHADLIAVDHDRAIVVDVPVKLTGVAEGTKVGGQLKQLRRSAKVRCLPKDIPVTLDFDVTPLDLKMRALASQIVPPAGVEVLVDNDFAIAQVNVPRGADDVVAEGEGEEGEAAAAAAPAAS